MAWEARCSDPLLPHSPRWPNMCNRLQPTMLRYLVLKCSNRLARALFFIIYLQDPVHFTCNLHQSMDTKNMIYTFHYLSSLINWKLVDKLWELLHLKPNSFILFSSSLIDYMAFLVSGLVVQKVIPRMKRTDLQQICNRSVLVNTDHLQTNLLSAESVFSLLQMI